MTTNTAALVRQLRNALIDARDDVQAELQRCTELAGRPSTDRRLAAQVALALDVDLAIADADKWLAEQPAQSVAQPPTDEWLLDSAGATLYMHKRPAVDRLVRACADAWGVTLADGIGQPARDTKPCRCGPDGCADSACRGRTSCATT